MNADVKARWLAALRSGDYDQGQCRLRDEDDRFCCLGVLCDVVDPDGWDDFGPPDVSHRGQTLTPGKPFSEDVGLGYFERDTLITMNDDLGYDFCQIADWIEENL